jgi:DNA-binding beta-propeller fold protein YncE
MVFDADTMAAIDGMYVRPFGDTFAFADSIATTADGKTAYVTVQEWDFTRPLEVAVVDINPASATYNEMTARLTGGGSAVSPDGSRRYVLQADGKTVNVYNTATNAVIGSFVTDQGSAAGARSIAVGPDGTVYVADAGDNKVYIVTVGSVPSAL